jgi:pimeloyl-ACP methyl ester carboxylesterase
VVDEIAFHMRRARRSGYMAVAEAIATTDARPWLKSIDQPCLIMCGEHDGVTGLQISQYLADHLSSAQMVKIPSAGHAPHIEQADIFAQAVRQFLKHNPPSLA